MENLAVKYCENFSNTFFAKENRNNKNRLYRTIKIEILSFKDFDSKF